MPPSATPTSTKETKRGHRIRIKMKRNKSRDSSDSSSQNQPDPPPKAKRNLFNIGSISSSHSSSTNSWKAGDSITMNGDITSPKSPSPLVTSASANSFPSISEPPPPLSPLTRKQSLACVFQEKLSTDEAEDNESECYM